MFSPQRQHFIAPPAIVRRAELPAGAVFFYGGRPLVIVRCYGTDAAAPIIVMEPGGQYALWAADGVARAMRSLPL